MTCTIYILAPKCNLELEERKVTFSYLERQVSHPIMRCPGCGQVFIPESLVKDKMMPLEKALEEK